MLQRAPLVYGDFSGHLLHPALIWVLGDARNDHPSGINVYAEQDVVSDQALEGQDLCAEEVSGGQHCAVALNELCPCLLAPNSRSMPPRKQTPPPTQRGQPQRPVDTIQAPCPRLW